ncbi:MAG TPA: polyketide cyclase [Verrucomicrobiales bacterium]|nr:polyketide cyclase [Verrucomicrobiales bacterium]
MSTSDNRELVITREIDLPAERLYRGWTDPTLLKQWFCPKPWSVARAEPDVRPGGTCLVVMRSPEGEEISNPGVYLEVVPNRRLVFTDAYLQAWEPSGQAFMTAMVTFDDLSRGRTRYIARAMHWSAADRQKHEKMGFHEGWNKCLNQLIELVGRN